MTIASAKTFSTRVFLIRHGQTDSNKNRLVQGPSDTPLNEEGIRQAQSLSTWIKKRFSIDAIRTSPEKRALQTARIINKNHNVDLHVDPNLVEVDFGSLKNLKIDDLILGESEYIQQFNHFLASYKNDEINRPELPDGEYISEIEGRIRLCIDHILNSHNGEQILVVTHSTFMKCMMTYISGASLYRHIPYRFENTSITIIDFYGCLPMIRRLNDTNHLNQPLESKPPSLL